jgi:hypothetical protein
MSTHFLINARVIYLAQYTPAQQQYCKKVQVRRNVVSSSSEEASLKPFSPSLEYQKELERKSSAYFFRKYGLIGSRARNLELE